MLAFGWTGFLLSVAIVGVSLLLIGLILLQKNRGAGLSGAFGGVGGHSAFGTKTGDFLTWVTVSLVGVFLLLNVIGNYVFEPEKSNKHAGAALIPDSSAPSPQPSQPSPIKVTPVSGGASKNAPMPIKVTPKGPAPMSATPAMPAPTGSPAGTTPVPTPSPAKPNAPK